MKKPIQGPFCLVWVFLMSWCRAGGLFDLIKTRFQEPDMKPETEHLQLQVSSRTLHPVPYIFRPASSTTHIHTPRTPHLAPYPLHLTPYNQQSSPADQIPAKVKNARSRTAKPASASQWRLAEEFCVLLFFTGFFCRFLPKKLQYHTKVFWISSKRGVSF
jgi:hypothetical protein